MFPQDPWRLPLHSNYHSESFFQPTVWKKWSTEYRHLHYTLPSVFTLSSIISPIFSSLASIWLTSFSNSDSQHPSLYLHSCLKLSTFPSGHTLWTQAYSSPLTFLGSLSHPPHQVQLFFFSVICSACARMEPDSSIFNWFWTFLVIFFLLLKTK